MWHIDRHMVKETQQVGIPFLYSMYFVPGYHARPVTTVLSESPQTKTPLGSKGLGIEATEQVDIFRQSRLCPPVRSLWWKNDRLPGPRQSRYPRSRLPGGTLQDAGNVDRLPTPRLGDLGVKVWRTSYPLRRRNPQSLKQETTPATSGATYCWAPSDRGSRLFPAPPALPANSSVCPAAKVGYQCAKGAEEDQKTQTRRHGLTQTPGGILQ